MQILQIAEIVIGSIISLGILVAGAGYGYGQFYKGKNAKTIEDFNLFNTQLDTLQKVCNEQAKQILDLQSDIKKHSTEIGRLQGINEEKEKKVQELTALLQNRDPALGEYMKYGRESIEEFKTGLKNVIDQLQILNKK